MKKGLLISFLAALALTTNAQEKNTITLPSWLSNVKLSGYVLTQYQYSDQESTTTDAQGQDKSNSFNLRLARIALDGRIAKDFYWKTQIQINGNTSSLGSSPRIVDLFTEWQKYKAFRIKFGQYKRPFTFENPMNPIDQGFYSYSQLVNKLAGFSDRNGSHASNGRDIGLQFQGDLFPDAHGRAWFHYQVGVFNGQGINTKDVDQRKDLIGGAWIMPIEGLRIGAFGWEGSYARKGNWTDEKGTAHSNEVRSLPQHRYAISGEYVKSDWTFRSEYAHSTGKAFAKTYNSGVTDCSLSSNGEKSDAVYALVIAPIIKKKLHVKARYDLYRPNGKWDHANTQYEIGADYEFHHNFEISGEFCRVNNRALVKHDYNMIDVEVDWRF
ncbi:MAG: OprO/OprP family phosphate-selective porin [Prevotella sp.]|jgi:hypothetical protein|nr:OprO/OprP family phosphate-selective porin [Prevotella sp.]HCN54723.1 porin [Prevotella sp.]